MDVLHVRSNFNSKIKIHHPSWRVEIEVISLWKLMEMRTTNAATDEADG